MPNDAKLGLIAGVAIVLLIAALFFRKEDTPAQAAVPPAAPSVMPAASPALPPPSSPESSLPALPPPPTPESNIAP